MTHYDQWFYYLGDGGDSGAYFLMQNEKITKWKKSKSKDQVRDINLPSLNTSKHD